MGNTFNPHKKHRIAVSACLLGQKVRYDGRNKLDRAILGCLTPEFELLPVCPEVEAGLAVPRPPVHLVQTARGVRALGVDNAELDVTEALLQFSDARLASLEGIVGYVFKARSPSCGLQVPLAPSGVTQGLFAKVVQTRWPRLPVIEESALQRAHGCEGFVRQVRKYAAQCKDL